MPLYEYRCLDCKKCSTLLVLSLANQAPVACSHCTSLQVERILSRFASPKSEEARLEALADPSNLAGLDEMGEDLGDDLSEAMESGDPGSVESDSTDSL
jgi:putative FmdB family regulatory protein